MIAESWFKAYHTDDMLAIRNYKLYRKDRVKRKGGGVCFYVKHHLSCNIYNFVGISRDVNFEDLWLEVNTVDNTFYICGIYNPPNPLYNQHDFVTYLNECIDNIMSKHAYLPVIILCGDFNALPDLAVESLGLTNYVLQPTHGANYLDRLYCNIPLYSYVNVITSSVKTAHKGIIASSVSNPIDHNKTRQTYKLRPYSPQQFEKLFSDLSALKFPISTTNYTKKCHLASDFQNFYNFLTNVLDKYFPLRTVTITSRDPYYMTPYLKFLLRQKQKSVRSGDLDKSNALATKIQEQITSNVSKTFFGCDKNNTKLLWSKINNIRGTKRDNTLVPDHITAEVLNNHYRDISTNQNYLPTSSKLTCQPDPAVAYSIPPIIVLNFLTKLKSSAAGMDDLPHWFLRSMAPLIAEPLSRLFSASLALGYVPPQWKTSLINPIPKISKPLLPADFRPISLTPILSRVFEKIFVRQYLYPLMLSEKVSPLLRHQFAFRPSGSTTAAIIHLFQTVTDMLASHPFVHVIALDYSKAFDTLSHSSLTDTLSRFGLSDEPYNWLCEYLDSRKHVTKFNQQFSTSAEINCSVVQGSAIGPACYILTTSTLSPINPNNKISSYADDGYLIVPASHSNDIPTEMQNIADWAQTCNLKLNMSKTHEIIISNKNYDRSNVPPPLPNIQRVETLTMLGITFDHHLSLTPHVKYITNKSFQKLYMLKVLKFQGLPLKELSNVCKSVLISALMYASPAWRGFLSSSDIQLLQAVLNKCYKWDYLTEKPIFTELADRADHALFDSLLNNPTHVLTNLLPPVKTTPYQLRPGIHSRCLPNAPTRLQRCTFIARMLFKDIY